MRKSFTSKILLLLALIFFLNQSSSAQTITTPYTGSFTSFAATANISFVIENTNANGIILTGLGQYCQTTENNSVWELYYSSTSLSGVGTPVPGSAWTLIATSPATPVGVDGITSLVFSGLNFLIPAGTQYRFVMKNTGPGMTRYVLSPTPSQTLFSNAGVNLKTGTEQIAGANVGYSGQTTALATTPRYWHGSITFVPDGPCTSPPTPGSATASPSTAVCSGSAVVLSTTGTSGGSGQTFAWESSSTLNGTYSPISGTLSTANYTINPTATMFYRAAVTCGGNTQYSDTLQVMVNPALPGGIYTIGPSGTYTTFAAAISALSCGIAGHVVFEVAAGTYNEQVTIPAVIGASEFNTITFRGMGVVNIQAAATTTNRHLFRLDGADYIRLKRLNFIANASDFGWGIHLTNGADHNHIDSCMVDISAVTHTTQSNSAGIVASGSTTTVTTAGSASYNTITNNEVIGAWQGIRIVGAATALNAVQNVITDNIVRDFYSDGISLSQNDGSTVARNDISRAIRSTGGTAATVVAAFAGIEMGTGSKNCVVDANKIHDTHNSAGTDQGDLAYGIASVSDDAPVGSENRITNNIIYNFNSATGLQVGLYNSGSAGVFYYHNTVALDNQSSTAGATRGFYQTTSATNIRVQNNIFYITRSGTDTKHGVYFNTVGSEITSNNNVFYVNATGSTVGVGSLSTANSSTLSDWQNVNNSGSYYDQQSVAFDPLFVNAATADFMPTNGQINNIGANVGVATDFSSVARNVSAPDPGAFEFTTASDIAGPSIAYTPLVNDINLVSRALTATITDASGVQTGSNGPRLYYKKSTDASFIFDDNPSVSGNNYTFTMNFAALGGVTAGTIINYYVAAQDMQGNASTQPFGGTGATPPGTTPPPTTRSILILSPLSGTYTVGSGENYENLTTLANALNSGSVQIVGDVVFELQSTYNGTAGETFPIAFNTLPSNNPAWTAIIRPAAGVTARVTSGDPGTTNELITLDGVDNLSFDGRPGGTGSANEWTFRNTRTAATIGAVFRFINDATSNTLRNLNIEGQVTSTTSGLIIFSTAASGSLGNSFNSILNNVIRDRSDVTNTANVNGIYASGTTAAPNSSNIISGNHIQNFSGNGINLTATGIGNGWQILENSFFNNRAASPTAAQTSMLISGGSNHLISGNYIGGKAQMAGGTAWTNTGAVAMVGINLAGVGADGPVSVQGNVIRNITMSSATGSSFSGITITGASTVNVGTITGNTIGHSSVVNSIQNSGSSTTIGINSTSTASVTFHNNVIANITATGTGTSIGVRGISHTGAGSLTLTSNTIKDIKSAGATTSQSTSALLGIYSASSSTAQTIKGNVINGLRLTNAGAVNNYVQGINLNSSTGNGVVSENVITNLESTSTGATASIIGVDLFVGSWDIYNNMISISNGSNTNGITIIGIWDWPGATYTGTTYYNSVYISGSAASGSASTYAYEREAAGTSIVKNNIFYNTRTGGTGKHYAIGDKNTTPGTLLTSDFNNLAGNTTSIGEWGAGQAKTFAEWQSLSGGDASSISADPLFVSTTDLHLMAGSPAIGTGTPILAVLTDYDGQLRDNAPDMGADEYYAVSSTITDYFRSINSGNWTAYGTFESSPVADFTSGVVSPASYSPSVISNVISIRNGHTVTVAANVTTDQTFVNPGGTLAVTGSLTVLNNGLTIQSSAAGTARIGTSTGTISGNVTIERYIPASGRRAWRLLGANVSPTGAPTLQASWQEGGSPSSMGTHITQLGGAGTNGFDASTIATANHSVFSWNGTALVPPANTDVTKITDNGGAYFLFVRGNRNINLNDPAASSNTTMRMSGTVNQGPITAGVAGASFSLIPNPYPSPVDYEAIIAANGGLSGTYYIWDATLGSVGSYRTIVRTGANTYSSTPTTADNNSMRYIRSGQAFFIPDNMQVNFTEAMKTDMLPVINVYRPGIGTEEITIDLNVVDANGTATLYDGVRAKYNNSFSANIDVNDAPKLNNFNENLAIARSSKNLAIEARPLVDAADTIFLKLWNTGVKNYRFDINPSSFSTTANLDAYLVDGFLNTTTPVSLSANTLYDFSVTSNSASADADRFMIVFRSSTPLPVRFTTVKAFTKETGIQVEWNVAAEQDVVKYEVEKSVNGTSFDKGGEVTANNSKTYNWFDAAPNNGNNFYRIKVINKDNTYSYSNVVNVKLGNTKGDIAVYPNPVKGSVINVQFNNLEKGTYNVQLINSIGQQVYSSRIVHQGGSASEALQLNNALSKGVYQLVFTNGSNRIVQQVVAE